MAALNDVYQRSGLPVVRWDGLPEAQLRATEEQSKYIDSLKHRYAVYRRKTRASSGSDT